MKKLLYSAMLFFTSYALSEKISLEIKKKHDNPDPVLVAVLMIKNEEPVIVDTLKPLVEGGIEAFFIYDTGSTDRTVQITEDYLKEKNVKYFHIAQEPFIDFAASRNRALDLTEEKFPNAAFMVMLDAEWHLQNTAKLIEFCKVQAKNPNKHHSYMIQIKSSNMDFYVQRLFTCRTNLRYKGVVHESPEYGTRAKVPDEIFFQLNNTRFGLEKTVNRMRTRDLPMLLKSYKENPHDSRTVFYLAQTYECVGDWPNAYKFYKLRTQLKGWEEEDFMAQYKLAIATENLKDTDPIQSWPMALNCYLKSFKMRPTRAEPLVRIAQHYLDQDNFHLCYLFAQQAAKIPYPKDDVLFIEKEIYEYQRYDILGRCAWYVGKYNKGERATRKALQAYPNAQHLINNLNIYMAHKAAAAA